MICTIRELKTGPTPRAALWHRRIGLCGIATSHSAVSAGASTVTVCSALILLARKQSTPLLRPRKVAVHRAGATSVPLAEATQRVDEINGRAAGHDQATVSKDIDETVLELQERMVDALATSDPDDEAPVTLDFFDALYARFTSRHGPLPAGEPEYRAELLRAFREGDTQWMWADLKDPTPGSWDLVFPPARRREDGTRDPSTEGWVRTPHLLFGLLGDTWAEPSFRA